MKLYTVIDIPDGDYEASNHWVVGGDIRFLSEDGKVWIPYTYSQYGYELRPLLQINIKEILEITKHKSRAYKFGFVDGFNYCKKLVGETE